MGKKNKVLTYQQTFLQGYVICKYIVVAKKKDGKELR